MSGGRRSIAMVLVALWAAACSGGGAPAATGSVASTAASAAPTLCDSVDEFEGLLRTLRAPKVFSLSRDELETRLGERRELLTVFRDAVEDDGDRAALESLLIAREQVDEVIVNSWSDRREEFVESGIYWERVVGQGRDADEEIQEALGRAFQLTFPIPALIVGCRAPELLDPPDEDRSVDVDPGFVIVHQPGGGGTGSLAMVDLADGSDLALEMPPGWANIVAPAVAPDGTTIAAIALRLDGSASGLAIRRSGEPWRVVHEVEDLGLQCTQWSVDGQRVYVTAVGGDRNELLVVDLDGAVTPIDVDLVDFLCADELPDGRLVAGGATDDRSVPGGFALLGADGSDAELLPGPADCVNVFGGVSPDGARIVAGLACPDPVESGLYVIDVADGSTRHLVHGTVGLPRWSPSGDWITFPFARYGTDPARSLSVWLIRADGAGLQQLTPPASSWPAWVRAS